MYNIIINLMIYTTNLLNTYEILIKVIYYFNKYNN